MAVFRLESFAGIAPAKSARLLGETLGQKAENVTFTTGRLSPIEEDLAVATLSNGQRQSIYYYERIGVDGGSVFQFNEANVSVVQSPIAQDTYERAYWTGQDYPRMGTYTSMISGSVFPAASYRLGVPAPTSAPTLAKTGTANATEEAQDLSYVYTLVTSFGEEGPPSPASAIVEWTSTETVSISMPSANDPSGAYDFSNGLKRIYRANVGSTATYFQFVAEVPFSTVSYSDNKASATLGEVLPSETWVGPPDDNTSLYPDGPLQGLLPIGNGVFAGFAGARLCLSEPYLPHAWPIQYRLTIEEEIVGLSATNNGLVVMTKGYPYFVTGTEPSAMTAIQVDVAQSCINKESIVDMGEYVLYAGPDGLVQVSNTTGSVVSSEFIEPKQWAADFYASSYKAFLYEGLYVAFWNDGATDGGWIFDPRQPQNAFSTFTMSNEVRGGFTRKKTGKLYLIIDNEIVDFRGSSVKRTSSWKSRKFVSTPTSMGCIKVHSDQYPIDVKVWGDGVLIADYQLQETAGVYTQVTTVPAGISNGNLTAPVMRLPSNYGCEWEVEVSSTHQVNEVVLASTMAEINA